MEKNFIVAVPDSSEPVPDGLGFDGAVPATFIIKPNGENLIPMISGNIGSKSLLKKLKSAQRRWTGKKTNNF